MSTVAVDRRSFLKLLAGGTLAAAGCGLPLTSCAPGGSTTRQRVIVLGLDGLDPTMLEALMAAGRAPNFRRLAAMGCFHRLRTTMPALSPVAWSSFITGHTPGGHGISWLFLVLSGALVGLAAGIMGVGGGFLTFPIFVYILGVSSMTTVGTDIFQEIYGLTAIWVSRLILWCQPAAISIYMMTAPSRTLS